MVLLCNCYTLVVSGYELSLDESVNSNDSQCWQVFNIDVAY